MATKPCKLSKDLAAIVGTDVMSRPQVVSKMWSVIRERNLFDPNNKRYAICDAQLLKVFGVERFLIFGMMKYLKNHFTNIE